MKTKHLVLFVLFTSLYSRPLLSQTDSSIFKNILYAETGSKKLLLDLYMPANKNQPFLIVWIHGGAWRSGSKESPPLGMLPYGYALASINYRLSEEAAFPAMVYDTKAAIRFLRANAQKYGYRSDQIIIWGASAGGHLAALTALTNNDKEMEGNVGNHLNESSSIQVILDFFGPSNLLSILDQSTPKGLSVRIPALTLLFGKPVEQATDIARKASPVYQVDPTDPPLFIVHGDQDPQVPEHKLPVQLEIIPGAAHGGEAYDKKELMQIMDQFLNKVLKK